MSTHTPRPFLARLVAKRPARLFRILPFAATAMGAALMLGNRSALAASQNWTGDADANWTTPGNWSGNAVPGINPSGNNDNTTDVATFNSDPSTGYGTTSPLINDSNRMIGRIVFDTGAGAFNIGAASGAPTLLFGNNLTIITLNAGVTAAQNFNAPIALHLPSSTNGAATIANNATSSSATLTLTGGILDSPNSTRGTAWTLSGTNTGDNTVSGAITLTNTGSITSSLTKTGTGTWVLAASNTIAGGITINAGTLAAANNGALTTNSSANSNNVNINSGGTLQIRTGITIDNGVSLNLASGGIIQGVGTSATNGRINVGTTSGLSATISTANAADVFTVGNGSNDFTGGAADSVVNISGPGTVLLGQSSSYAGGISISNGSTLQINSDTALGAATSANLTLAGNGKLTIGTTAVRNPTVVSLSSTSATTVIQTGFTGTSTLTVNTAAGFTSSYAGILQNGTGTLALTKGGLGTLTLSGTSTYSGATTVTGGGTLNLDFSATTAPISNIIGSSSALSLGGAGGGTLNLTGGAGATNTQTVSGLTVNSGANRINYTPGTGGTTGLTVTTAVTASATSHGSLQFSTGGTTTLSGNLSSAILLNSQNNPYATYGTDDWAATGSTGVVQAAAYTNAATGFTASVNNTVTGSFSTGTVALTSLRFADSTGRTVTINSGGTLTAGGILVASTAGTSSLLGSSGFVRNTRSTSGSNYDFNVIQNSANDFTIGANVTNASSSNTALVKSGSGRLILSNASNGYTSGTYVNGGVLSISSNGNLGSATTGASVTLAGGNLEATTTLTLDNSGANIRAVTLNATSGLYASNGTILTVDGIISGAGGLVVNPAGGTYTSSGNTITDTGTVTLSNANTYTGTTTINAGTLSVDSAGTTSARLAGTTNITVNSGGTLLFANSVTTTASTDRINNSATVTLAGGTINTGGLSEGVSTGSATATTGLGALTLSSNSIIDFGSGHSGSSVLAFANSSGTTWNGTLTLTDFTAGTDYLNFASSTGLTAAQLAEITYTSGTNTFVGSGLDSFGNVTFTPVPEPATIFGGLAMVGVLGYRARRYLSLVRVPRKARC